MRRVCGSCAIGWGAVSEGFLRASQAACPFYSGRIGFLPGRRFAGTILFCQICPLTVRPSPMPDETEQPDRKIDETGIIATRSGSPTCAAGAAGTDVVGRARLSRSMRRSIYRVSRRLI